ncbi:MAG: glycosyltransferase [Dysgonamonadaceae bacterium]|jgi:glycosyltransferase involved in cell wall biosynthesis|nr:glycosyltransferase [Dysgonamonadaceae bacterium]
MNCRETAKQKIVYLLPGGLFNSGGMERTVTLKANYLAGSLDYDVSIVTTEQMGRPVFYSLSDKVMLYHLNIGIHEKFGKESYPEKIVSRFLKTREYRRKLSQLLNNIRPDITVSTLGLDIGFLNDLKDGSIKIGELHFPGNFRTLMANKLSKNIITNLVAKLRTIEMKQKCSKLSRLAVLTQEEKSFWTNQNNIEVIPNPLSFTQSETAALNSKTALAIGRLASEKGFDMLIDTWQLVVKKHPDWTLSIYGDGNQKEALLKQIKESGMTGKIIINEPVRNIQNIYLEHSIFLFPSRYLDALPMVLLEAFASGLPVVAFDAPCGPKDLIADRQNGFLVKTGDIQSFADKICLLIESSHLRNQMGQAAKASSENFHIEKIMARWDTLFKNAGKRPTVVSGINLFRGGTLKIMQDCIAAFSAHSKQNHNIIALVHDEKQYPEYPNVRYISFPKSRKSWLFRLYYEYIYFYFMSKRIKPYCWFSLHDTTPNVAAEKRIVYCHNTFSFYRAGFRNLFVQPDIVMFTLFSRYIHRINIHKNNFVVVQQEWLRQAFRKTFGINNIIVSLPVRDNTFAKTPSIAPSHDKTLFFYPSTPMIHKNFEAVCEAAKNLAASGFNNFEVAITLNGTENRYSSKIYERYKKYPFIKFTGLLSREEMTDCYERADCVVFSSKIESWGLPVSEAKEFGKPVLVSDLPYARETVGQYGKACFFNPDDTERLTILMKNFIQGTIKYDDTNKTRYEEPFTQNWDELIKFLF